MVPIVNNNVPSQNSNPLSSFMRQPKIFIRLPSNGEFWEKDSLHKTENGEYPIYSMTAKDELMLKIPDAVMSGQAVVDVIQHCVPNVKNAWLLPSIDLDAILIAIRIATYGEKMNTPLNIGTELESLEYQVDLRTVLDSLMNQVTWEPAIQINENITVFVKPVNYKQLSESALKTFETQKIIQVANDASMSEEEKLKIFKDSFSKLTEVTIGMVQNSIYRIDTPAGSTVNPAHIKEFIENSDKEIFNAIQQHLDKLRDINTIKPLKVPVSDLMREKGYTGTDEFIEVPLVFDPSTFFG